MKILSKCFQTRLLNSKPRHDLKPTFPINRRLALKLRKSHQIKNNKTRPKSLKKAFAYGSRCYLLFKTYLNVTISRTRYEKLLVRIHREAFYCVIVSLGKREKILIKIHRPRTQFQFTNLEPMPQSPLPHVEDANVAFLSSRY